MTTETALTCDVCGREPVTMCRPHDAFITSEFGLFDDPGVCLCARCDNLWNTQFFGTLASDFLILCGGVYRRRCVHMSDIYALLCQYSVMTKAKLN